MKKIFTFLVHHCLTAHFSKSINPRRFILFMQHIVNGDDIRWFTVYCWLTVHLSNWFNLRKLVTSMP